MEKKIKLKDILPILGDDSKLFVKDNNVIVDSLTYKNVLPFLDYDVIDISTNGYETIFVSITEVEK